MDIGIGQCPLAEQQIPVDDPEYERRSRDQCVRFMSKLTTMFGNPPGGSKLRIDEAERAPWDRYLEVVYEYDAGNRAHESYAHLIEKHTPRRWDD